MPHLVHGSQLKNDGVTLMISEPSDCGDLNGILTWVRFLGFTVNFPQCGLESHWGGWFKIKVMISAFFSFFLDDSLDVVKSVMQPHDLKFICRMYKCLLEHNMISQHYILRVNMNIE